MTQGRMIRRRKSGSLWGEAVPNTGRRASRRCCSERGGASDCNRGWWSESERILFQIPRTFSTLRTTPRCREVIQHGCAQAKLHAAGIYNKTELGHAPEVELQLGSSCSTQLAQERTALPKRGEAASGYTRSFASAETALCLMKT